MAMSPRVRDKPRTPPAFFSLSTRARNAAFLASCVAIALLYVALAARPYIAAELAARNTSSSLRFAIRIDPGNAELYDRLSSHQFLEEYDVPAAAASISRATRLNPHSARYWLDSAFVAEGASDRASERAALQNATASDSTTPMVISEIGHFYAAMGDTEAAITHFHRAMELAPDYAESIIAVSLRVVPDARRLLDEVIPPRASLYTILLRQLISRNDNDAADFVWQRMVALHQPLDPREQNPYFDNLLARHDGERLWRAWNDLASVSPVLNGYMSVGNSVVDGGFEHDILRAGLDWHFLFGDQPHILVAVDPAVAHSGQKSQSLSFDYVPGQTTGLAEYLPVTPGKTYELAAFVKSEDLKGAAGPRLVALDAFSRVRVAESEEVLGTSDWRRVSIRFTVPEGRSVILVCTGFDPGGLVINGRLWIDDVTLRSVHG